jgi:hypothetical protein
MNLTSDSLVLDNDWKTQQSNKEKFWSSVKTLYSSKYRYSLTEYESVSRLAAGSSWFQHISPEWIDIYSAIYDDSRKLPVDPSVETKIDKDIHRTFRLFGRIEKSFSISTNKINLSEYVNLLKRVLLAVSHGGRGYTQGLNFIAAFFLISFDGNDTSAFVAISYLLKQRYLDVLFSSKSSSLLEYMKIFSRKLRKYHKNIYSQLKTKEYPTICYALEWFTTFFIVSCPKTLATYIIDLLFADVPNIMLRVGLAIMNHLESFISKASSEEIHMHFKARVKALDPIQIISHALGVDLECYGNILQVSCPCTSSASDNLA